MCTVRTADLFKFQILPFTFCGLSSEWLSKDPGFTVGVTGAKPYTKPLHQLYNFHCLALVTSSFLKSIVYSNIPCNDSGLSPGTNTIFCSQFDFDTYLPYGNQKVKFVS